MVSKIEKNTLERKIYFFRADMGDDEGGKPLTFDPSPALSVISSLPFTNDDDGAYQSDVDGNALCLKSHSGDFKRVRFYRVRRTGLPQLEKAGQISDLNLDIETGLLEAIHIVFFPDNIVGSEYNHYGPRVSRLGNYLHTKSNGAVPMPAFRPLLRGDAAKQLDRLTEIRLFDISIRPSFADFVRQADKSLADAFDANAQMLSDQETVQLVIKPQRGSRHAALQKFLNPFKELIGAVEFHQAVDRFQLRGKCEDTNCVETIDLLKDQLISTIKIVRLNERSRALDPDSAFEAVREAYQEFKDDLLLATTISL